MASQVVEPAIAWPLRTATRERNREALLLAARDLAAERGYYGVSVEAIAQRAGLTKGAVYSNFGSKFGLFTAMVSAEYRTLQGLRLINVATPGQSVPDALEAFGREWFRISLDTSVRQALITTLELSAEYLRIAVDGEDSPAIDPFYIDMRTRTVDELTEDLIAVAGAGSPYIPGARRIATAIVAALGGYVQGMHLSAYELNEEIFASTARTLAELPGTTSPSTKRARR